MNEKVRQQSYTARKREMQYRVFHLVCEAGANRHPRHWMAANQKAANAIRDIGERVDDFTLKTLAATVCLRVLDMLRPLGRPDEPSDKHMADIIRLINTK